jgi:hypothetical protein
MVWGDNRFMGHSVKDDLTGSEDLMSMLALGITGRRLTEQEREMLNDLSVASAVGDPRIWPLKAIRVATSYGSHIAGLSVMNLCLDDAVIGHLTVKQTTQFLLDFQNEVLTIGFDQAIKDLIASNKRISGFGVPFRDEDERLVTVKKRVIFHKRDTLPYWTLSVKLANAIKEAKGLKCNVGLAFAALHLDMGFTPMQAGLLTICAGQIDYMANVAEGAQQSHKLLQNLPDECIEYVGPETRKSPRCK